MIVRVIVGVWVRLKVRLTDHKEAVLSPCQCDVHAAGVRQKSDPSPG